MPEKPVAGIDVSKDFSDMCIITPDNKVFQTVHIFHDATSLRRSLAALEAAAREFREKPVIVMESTAHYHRVIAQFLQSNGLNNFFLYLTICCYKLLIQQLFFLLLPKSY